jgi:hypothetical protein
MAPPLGRCYARGGIRPSMFDLTAGELFVVVFITVAVVSAPWWLRLGELVALMLAGHRPTSRDQAAGAPPGGGEPE